MVKRKAHTITYICDECVFIFQTFGKPKKNKPYCPNCGEFLDVRKHEGIHSAKESIKNLKTRWKPEELEIIDKCAKGEMPIYQAVILTGRTKDSVTKKVKRTKEAMASECRKAI